MSAEYGYQASLPPPPPPPPPTSAPREGGPSPQRRLALQPPTITTALAPQQGAFLHSQTPASASSLSTPFSPYTPSNFSAPAASRGSSPMALRSAASMAAPYNPQQWGRNGPVGGAYVPHSSPQSATVSTRQRELTGLEANLPSPPPPYTPGQAPIGASPHMSSGAFAPSHNPSPSSGHGEYLLGHRTSSGPDYYRSPPAFDHRMSTASSVPASAVNPPLTPSFPPPPPVRGRDRSESRPRPEKQHSLFNLSSLTRSRASDNSTPPSAIESLRIGTSEVLSRNSLNATHGSRPSQSHVPIPAPEFRWSPDSPARAPGSRRAASTGAIGLAGASSRTPIDHSPLVGQSWEPGMPLPPPPPGPPPSTSRSQSMSRTPDSFSRGDGPVPAPPTRRPAQTGTSLAPIPPTPVGWQDEADRARSRSPAARGLHLDTTSHGLSSQTSQYSFNNSGSGSGSGSGSNVDQNSTSTLSSGGLARAPAKRDPSARGIRERRSESRAARERAVEAPSAVEPNNNPWAHDMEAASSRPADLVLTSTTEGVLSRRRGINKSTPRSGRNMYSPRDAQTLSGAKKSFDDLQDPGSNNSTPRVDVHRVRSPETFAPTPPFSPGADRFKQSIVQRGSPAIPPKTLPTPPPQHLGDDYSSGLSIPKQHERPISHILHTPNIEADAMPAPLSPARTPSAPASAELNASTPRPSERDLFAQSATERHRKFIEQEISAQTDQERLELFAEFIVTESRLRRDRYSTAFDAMASDILDLTRDMWRSYGTAGRRSTTPNASTLPSASGRRSQASAVEESPDARVSAPTTAASPTSSMANDTLHTEPSSPSSASSQGRGRENQAWNSFQPCLSPIPSMTVSTETNEENSRGRSASRWWEASADGDSSGRGGKRIERSKRESKYMGLPREAREHLQWEAEPSPSYGPGPSNQQSYGPDEYPPEKTGLHDQAYPSSSHSYNLYSHSAPATPDPYKLDVSRLVTLPPPYPRHHPAVNNNHPDLASIRTSLRTLSDLQDVGPMKENFAIKDNAHREQERADLSERRNQLRYNIQENIRTGVMSFADAAKAEADFDARENKRSQDLVQNSFDEFQKDVASPLHALLSERVTKISASIEHLRSGLFNDARESNPNQTQEEGDEQPELLEKLTLLKWLFEAREQLHREMFELEDERNDRYKDIVVTPYKQAGNDGKVREAENFFQRDAQDRKVVFEKETLKRFEEFMSVIEENVTRGVEIQLSAFWDIAPGLLAVVQKIPSQLTGFEVLIPPQEYEENPAYHDFPLQYLYSLLAHAGKSAYQFIESQTNLLCLLHEVKTGVMTANSRLLETQRYLAGEDFSSIDREMKAVRNDEERRLTEDLKEKVGLVEGQWREALGQGLEDCKARVEEFLVDQGGWDESLND